MKLILSLLLVAVSCMGAPASSNASVILYEEDFDSGWTYGQTIVQPSNGWTAGNSSYNNSFIVQSGTLPHLDYSAGSARNLTYRANPEFVIDATQTYELSFLVRNDDIGNATDANDNRGTLFVSLQGDGGKRLATFALRNSNTVANKVGFGAGSNLALTDANAAPGITTPLTEALEAETWYRVSLIYNPADQTASLYFYNNDTNALIVSATGALSGTPLDATKLRGFAFDSGTYATESSSFLITDISLKAIPEPSAMALGLFVLPLLWAGRCRLKCAA